MDQDNVESPTFQFSEVKIEASVTTRALGMVRQ
jgi:hypothetical protein